MKILGDYEMKKAKVIELLHDVRQLAREAQYDHQRIEESFKSYEASLESGMINIAVVGEWNNGKSTLINALLGCSLLISKNKECTAAITRIVHSDFSYIKVVGTSLKDQGSPLIYKKDIDNVELSSILEKYATTSGVDVEGDVEYVEIGWPYPLLDKKVIVIDTPGVNSHSEVRSRITHVTLPQCHAILMLVDINKPGSTYEVDFINKIIRSSQGGNKVFVLLNKIDSVPEDSLVEGVETLKKALKNAIPDSHILGISSLAALYSARLKESSHDPEEVRNYPPSLRAVSCGDSLVGQKDPGYIDALYKASNIQALYETLSRHLAEECGSKFIFNPAISAMKNEIQGIITHLTERINSSQNDISLEEMNNRIKEFERRIPLYEHDKLKTTSFFSKEFDETHREYSELLSSSDLCYRIYDDIEMQISSYKIKDLTAKKYAKLNILVQNSIASHITLIGETSTRKLQAIKEGTDRRLADIAQDIQAHIEVIFTAQATAAQGVPGALEKAVPAGMSGSALAASSLAATAAAASVVGVSTTSIATGVSFLGFSTGWGATLPFLATNPIGWAVGAAILTGGLAYLIFRKKPGADDLMKALREQKCVENQLKQMKDSTHSSWINMKTTVVKQIDNIIESLISRARSELDHRIALKKMKVDELARKIQELEDCIGSAKALEEKIICTFKSED